MQNMGCVRGATVARDFDATGLTNTTSAVSISPSINLATATTIAPFAALTAVTGGYFLVYKNCKTWCLVRGDLANDSISITNIYDGINIECIKDGDSVEVTASFPGEILAEPALLDLYQVYTRLTTTC